MIGWARHFSLAIGVSAAAIVRNQMTKPRFPDECTFKEKARKVQPTSKILQAHEAATKRLGENPWRVMKPRPGFVYSCVYGLAKMYEEDQAPKHRS